jgi:hypothetical protein
VAKIGPLLVAVGLKLSRRLGNTEDGKPIDE